MRVVVRTMQVALLVLLIVLAVPSRVKTAASTSGSPPVDWVVGDVFVGVGNGTYQIYDPNANPPYSLVTTMPSDGSSGTTAGCAFDSGYRFFGTNFTGDPQATPPNQGQVDRYSINLDTGTSVQPKGNGLVQAITTGSGNSTHPESIVFDGHENFFVGHADNSGGFGGGRIERWTLCADGTFSNTGSFAVPVENRGADWIDLAADDQTVFYTSEGREILTVNLAAFPGSSSTSVFANLGQPGAPNFTLFALKILPAGTFVGNVNVAGDVLVADKKNIKIVDSSSNVVKTYDASGQDDWEALSLDPNGTSFWAGDATTHKFYRFNISTGAVEVGPISTGAGLGGICVDGAFSAAQPASTTVQQVTLTPSNNTANIPSPASTTGTTLTVTVFNIASGSVTLTARKSFVDSSVGISDPLIFQQSPGSPSGSTAGGNLACDQTFTTNNTPPINPGTCEQFEVEANPSPGSSFTQSLLCPGSSTSPCADYAVIGPHADFTDNLRLLRNHDQDVTTSVVKYPLSGTHSKCVLTVNQQTFNNQVTICGGGFQSPAQGQSFTKNQTSTITFKFQPSFTSAGCNGNTTIPGLSPLLLIAQLQPTANGITPAPVPISVIVAGKSGGPPVFVLSGGTYQLQVKTTDMAAGFTYIASVIDVTQPPSVPLLPSFSVQFSLQ